MLNNISWSNYMLTVVIGLAVYYIYVGARFYAVEIKELVSGKCKRKSGRTAFNSDSYAVDSASNQEAHGIVRFENIDDEEFARVESLVIKLKAAIADASQRKLIPEECRRYLQSVLGEFPSLKTSPLRPSINELIKIECKKHQIAAIEDNEVEWLW